MSNSASIGFFGDPDAHQDRGFFDSFEPIGAYENAKKGTTGSKFFITGVLGSGKTAVRYRIQKGATEAGAFVWAIDELDPPDQLIDFGDLRRHISAIASVTLNVLTWELANRIIESSSLFPAEGIQSLKELYPSIVQRFGEFAKKIVKATKLKPPGPFDVVELDMEKVLREKGGTLAKSLPLEEWKRALLPCLSQKPAYILLDDVEFLFPGLEDVPEAMDGLLYACELLNSQLREALTILVFLQWSTFVNLTRHSRRFEKLSARMERIRWSREKLQSLIASRLRERLGSLQRQSDVEVLGRIFDFSTQQQLQQIMAMATGLCVNGPRDLIQVCNMARDAAGDRKIGLEHFRAIQGDFSELKLDGIEREFGTRYPNIGRFIERFFTNKEPEYAPDQFESELTGILPEARGIFGNQDWLTAASRQVIEVLFQVGLLGYVAAEGSAPEYVINEPFAHRQPGFHTCVRFVVHPAFRERLGMSIQPRAATRRRKRT